MRIIRIILFALLMTLSYPLIAQADTEPKKDDARAKVEVVKGQNVLVLKAGCSSDITLKWDASMENKLDSLVTAPWGSAIKMKDVEGYNVEVAKANVNSRLGLMFTSGTKCVAISEEEWNKLKQIEL